MTGFGVGAAVVDAAIVAASMRRTDPTLRSEEE
jgi:hypothetical protein